LPLDPGSGFPNMDLDPQSHWSRIQSGSGSTTLFFFLSKWFISGS
jgi:hypothetical protein